MIQTVQLERFNFEKEINRLCQLRRVALWKAAQKLLSPNTAASQSLSPVCFASDYIRQWEVVADLEPYLRLEVTQRAMNRAMVGISLPNRIRSKKIRRRRKDTARRIARLKWQWVGRIAYTKDGRNTLKWRPHTGNLNKIIKESLKRKLCWW